MCSSASQPRSKVASMKDGWTTSPQQLHQHRRSPISHHHDPKTHGNDLFQRHNHHRLHQSARLAARTVSPPSLVPSSLTDSVAGGNSPTASANNRKSKSNTSTPNGSSSSRADLVENRVHHDYHDRAHEPPSAQVTIRELQAMHCKNSETAPFPLKLYHMLDKVQHDESARALVSWQPHGRCFLIHQPKVFVQTLLPHYFAKINKIASFHRQLNLYGFQRITQGRDRGAYYHEYFLRGKPHLAINHIHRVKVKGTGVRAKSNPAEEPDFYAMEWVGDQEQEQDEGHEEPHGCNLTYSQQPENTSMCTQKVVSSSDLASSSHQRVAAAEETISPIPWTAPRLAVPTSSSTTTDPMLHRQEEDAADGAFMEWGHVFYALEDSRTTTTTTTSDKSQSLAPLATTNESARPLVPPAITNDYSTATKRSPCNESSRWTSDARTTIGDSSDRLYGNNNNNDLAVRDQLAQRPVTHHGEGQDDAEQFIKEEDALLNDMLRFSSCVFEA